MPKFERIPGCEIRKSGDLIHGKIKVDDEDKWVMQALDNSRIMYVQPVILTMNELSALYRSMKTISELDLKERVGLTGYSWVQKIDNIKDIRVNKKINGSHFRVNTTFDELKKMFASAIECGELTKSKKELDELN